VKQSSVENIEKTMIMVAEITLAVLGAESERACGKPISKISVVVDLSSLGLRQLYIPALSFLTTMIQLLEAHYPETSGTIYLINAPPIFTAFWKIVSPVIPPRTMQTIFFLGTEYKKTLLQYIAAEDLPVFFFFLCVCVSRVTIDVSSWCSLVMEDCAHAALTEAVCPFQIQRDTAIRIWMSRASMFAKSRKANLSSSRCPFGRLTWRNSRSISRARYAS